MPPSSVQKSTTKGSVDEVTLKPLSGAGWVSASQLARSPIQPCVRFMNKNSGLKSYGLKSETPVREAKVVANEGEQGLVVSAE